MIVLSDKSWKAHKNYMIHAASYGFCALIYYEYTISTLCPVFDDCMMASAITLAR